MLRQLSMKKFLEWMAFDKLEPIGDKRGDWQAAVICSTLANIAVAKTRSRKRFKTKQFLLEFGPDKPLAQGQQQSWQEMKMIAQMVAIAFTDRPKKKGK